MSLPFALDFTLRTVALGAAVLGLVSGTLGTYAVLRSQSLLGDAISHAALPGIAIAFLLTGLRSPLVLVLGAAAAGWIGALVVLGVTKRTRIPYDASLGIVLSVFFGFGMVLLTFIQRMPSGNQAGLDTFLFGQAAALLPRDVFVMSSLGIVALTATALLWKELKLLAFDQEFGAALGLPMRRLDVVLTTLLVVAIVIGLQTVGVVLMSAILIAPAAAARQWSDRLGRIVVLAGIFGATAGVTGAVISASTPRLPTGPTIVLCAGAIMLVSLFLAPQRGLLAELVRQRRSRRNLRELGVLEDLYTLSRLHADPYHPHPSVVLRTMTSGPESVEPGLLGLEKRGWVRRLGGDLWGMTDAGLAAATREFARWHRAAGADPGDWQPIEQT
ncbi:MAG: iron chelate uptake ABC transporter family permease subunit [Gemmatimonadota bacterium]